MTQPTSTAPLPVVEYGVENKNYSPHNNSNNNINPSSQTPPTPPFSEATRFNIIYADPPWSFNNQHASKIRKHYPLMSTEDICRLPVAELTADNCALFLWTVNACVPDALRVMTAWGFTYKTVVFNWVKPCRTRAKMFLGCGCWTRANSELCLLGIKGSPKRVSKKVPQVIIEPRQEHSKKPDLVYKRIIALMGDLPRVELFARQKKPGWHAWGNQIASTIHLKETD